MEPRLTILLGLWSGWRDVYEIDHVNALSRQLKEYLKIPYKLVLLTDQDATNAEVDEVRPVPQDPKGMTVIQTVNCFRRLRYFDPVFNRSLGTEWVMSLDLDTLILRDFTEVIERSMDHPFGLWMLRAKKVRPGRRPYNGGMYMIRAGSHAKVWKNFDPVISPIEVKAKGWVGSDQTWIAMQVQGAPTWSMDDGMFFFGQYNDTPERQNEARIINFAGKAKPWTKQCRFENRRIWEEYMRWIDSEDQDSRSAIVA